MFNFVFVYPDIVKQAVEDVHPNNSILSNLHTHKVSTYSTTRVIINKHNVTGNHFHHDCLESRFCLVSVCIQSL